MPQTEPHEPLLELRELLVRQKEPLLEVLKRDEWEQTWPLLDLVQRPELESVFNLVEASVALLEVLEE